MNTPLAERNELILDTMTDSYILADLDGNIVQVNDAYTKISGYTKEELGSMHISQVECFLSEEEIADRIKEMKEKGRLSFETIHKTKGNEKVRLDVNSIVVVVDNNPFIAAFMRDITQRKMQEKQLKEALYQLNLAQKISHIGSWKWNMVTDEAEWSDEMYCIYGVNKDEFYPSNENVNKAIFEEDRYKFEVAIGELLQGKHPDPFEFRIKRPNGETRFLMILAVRKEKVDDHDLIIGVTHDITDINAVQLALNEKTILLKEIHHRVKNNLQIVSSLLSLQSNTMNDEKMQKALLTSRQRVESIALVHEKLYQNYSLKKVNLKSYIEDLIFRIFSATATKHSIKRVLKLEDIEIDLDRAVPVGLIINEILSNCFKYAFNDSCTNPLVQVDMKTDNEGYIDIQIMDNGIGFKEEFEALAEGSSLGFMLIKELTDQIDGKLTVKSDHGAHFHLRFKLN